MISPDECNDHHMKKKIHIYNFIFFLLVTYVGISQTTELKFNLVEGANGTPLGKINGITQDRYGYIWLAGNGNKCLYRYDGNRMISFRHDDANPNSLGGSVIQSVYADESGMIWIGMGEGLDKYNPATGMFKHYRNDPRDPGSLSIGNRTVPVLRDHKGRLWVGTDHGLDRLDETTGKFIHHRNEPGNPKSLSSDIVWNIYEDRQGVIWVGTGDPWFNKDPDDGGLNRLNDDGTFTRYLHDPKDSHSLINNKVAAMYEDSRGVFWVGTGGDGLHTLDRKTGMFERQLYDPRNPEKLSRPSLWQGKDSNMVKNDKITFITEDCIGTIWIGTMYSGMNRYDNDSKKITHFEGSNGFPDSSVWNAYNSRDGVLWICSENSGLLYRANPFHKFITRINTNNLVFGFLEDNDGYLWVATKGGGLLKYDQQNNLIRQYKNDPVDSFSLPDNNTRAVFQNDENSLWVGTDKGLRIFNKATQQFTRFRLDGNSRDIPFDHCTRIIRDKRGLIWFSTWGNGLFSYNPANHSIKDFLNNPKDTFSISSNEVGGTVVDESGNIWAGGSNGINRLDPKTERFKNYLTRVWGVQLFKSAKGEIWTGNEKGLFRYNPKEDQFSAFFDPEQQINGYTVGGITEDDAKNIWVTSQLGIIKLNPVTNETFIYDKKYGIDPGSIVAWAGVYKNREGHIFIPLENGFYTFSPDELNVKTNFKILITDLLINSNPITGSKGGLINKPLEEINDLNLNYNQNNISFNFAAIDYRAPEANRYFTLLENYDNTWHEIRGEKSSYFFNVPPGKYVYRVKAFNVDGTKGEKEIHIHINPPWWKTWWAYLIYIISLLSSIFIFIEYRSRALKKKNRDLEEKVSLRTKELNESLIQLKETQDQLIQSEKMASLGELTSGIAHEIKNPLNFINNFSEINLELLTEIEEDLLSNKKFDQEELGPILNMLKKNSEKINHHGGRVDSIVKGMLQHSRIGNGIKESININALCEESLQLAYHGFKAKEKTFNATLELHLDPALPKILCVPQDMGRVILNIINNAFYAIHEKKKKSPSTNTESGDEAQDTSYRPRLILTTKKISKSEKDSQISILISDNGMGIPQGIINKVFQPFFTTKPTGEGTGLGLSMSYDIVTKGHGGELKVNSKDGEGTVFEIILPYKP